MLVSQLLLLLAAYDIIGIAATHGRQSLITNKPTNHVLISYTRLSKPAGDVNFY